MIEKNRISIKNKSYKYKEVLDTIFLKKIARTDPKYDLPDVKD